MASSKPEPSLTGDLLLDALRHRGFRGTPILQHRALAWHRIRPLTILLAVLTAMAADTAIIAAFPALEQGWRLAMAFWLDPLAGAHVVGSASRPILPGLKMNLPVVTLAAGAPTGLQWLNTLIGAIVLALGSFLLPYRARPIAYLLRLIALVQFTSNAYFYAVPGQFPYSLREHVTTLFSGTCVLMLVVPWILALAYFPFDHRWSRKLGLLVLCLVFFAVFAPVWLALHAWLIHFASLAVQPTLYLVFGYPVESFLFVCLYGWGMAWRA